MLRDIKFAFHTLIHPIDGFYDLKYEKRGKFGLAVLILILTIGAFVFDRLATGFIFSHNLGKPVNVFNELKIVIIPFFLFIIANASITTLMDGQGKFKDIFLATCYALTPLILIKIPLTILTNIFTLQEAAYISALGNFALVWVAILLYFAIMQIHNYEPGKTIFIIILTIIAMVIILFICFLFFSLLSEIVGFIYTIIKELTYRF